MFGYTVGSGGFQSIYWDQVIQTNHRSHEWLESLKEGNPKLCRWSLALQPYEYTVEHRAGAANLNADALSRATKDIVAGEG